MSLHSVCRIINKLKSVFKIPTLLGLLILTCSIISYFKFVEFFQLNKLILFVPIFIFSLISISITISIILIFYGVQTNKFLRKYALAERYVEELPSEAPSNLFSDTFAMISYLVVGMVPGLMGTWIVYYWGNIGTWTLMIVCVSYTIYYFKRKKGVIIFHLIYLPVVLLLISVEAKEGAVFLVIFLVAVLLVEKHKPFNFLRHIHLVNSDRKVSLRNFVILTRYLSGDIHQKIYGKGSVNQWQAITIMMILVVYVIFPNVLPFFPPNLQPEFQQYLKKVNQAKDYIPHFVFFFYCGFSIAPFLGFFARIFSFRDEDEVDWKRGINFIIGIAITVLIMPMFVVLSMVMSIIILKVADSILGFYFAVILGFFVFPAWVTRVYAYIPTIVLLITPDNVLGAWGEGSDMWSFSQKREEFLQDHEAKNGQCEDNDSIP